MNTSTTLSVSRDFFSLIHYDDPFTTQSCLRVPFSTEQGIQIGRAIADLEYEKFSIVNHGNLTRLFYGQPIDETNASWVDVNLLSEPQHDSDLWHFDAWRRQVYVSPYSHQRKVKYERHPVIGNIRRLMDADQFRMGQVRTYIDRETGQLCDGQVFVYPTTINLGVQKTFAMSKHIFIRVLNNGGHVCPFGGHVDDMESAILTGYKLESAWLRKQDEDEDYRLDSEAMRDEMNGGDNRGE